MEPKILRVKKFNLWDIFLGEGWENWTRVSRINGKVSYVSGNKFPIKTLYKLMEGVK
jgi:hypothetical protein